MPPPARSMKASILIVDDRPANLLALEAVLEPLGQRVVQAASGEEALLRLLEEDFAVILLDVQMPGMDGLQTAEVLKSRDKSAHVPIIFITAISREPSFAFEGYSRGAVDYLTKPFEPEILRSKVAVFVDLFLKEETIKEQAAALRRREREDLLRRSEHRYRALTDAMPHCMWVARPDGSVYFANRVWLEYAGLSLDETLGHGYLAGVHEEERGQIAAGLAEACEKGRPFELHARLLRHDGNPRWHLVRTVVERDEGGAIAGFITTATDVDDHRRTEEARAQLLVREREARREAEVASRLKDEFLATVSHELRTPLTAIVSWTRILRTSAGSPERFARALETIERNARAQAGIIDNLLDVSDIVAGRVQLHLSAMKLSSVVEAAVESVRPACAAKSLRVSVESDPAEGYVSGDAGRLHQVIWNLLMNAIAFTPPEGQVRVQLSRRGPQLVVRVSDTGSGIGAEFLPHVFERFRQEDARTTRTHRGLGAGLAIVRHLVELHGGRAQADSPGEGKGTTITLYLPLASLIARAGALTSRPTSGSETLAGLRVLVVDGDAEGRRMVADPIARAGAEVTEASRPAEVLAALDGADPDVTLIDFAMAAADGYALLRTEWMIATETLAVAPALALTVRPRVKIEDGANAPRGGTFEDASAELVALVNRLAERRPEDAAANPIPVEEKRPWPR